MGLRDDMTPDVKLALHADKKVRIKALYFNLPQSDVTGPVLGLSGRELLFNPLRPPREDAPCGD